MKHILYVAFNKGAVYVRDRDKVYNLKDIRALFGLKQSDVAKLAGLATMYISLMENNKRSLTQPTADKIADSINFILSGESGDMKISSEELRANHIASFYPDHIKYYIRDLIHVTTLAAKSLEYFYNMEDVKLDEAEMQKIMEIMEIMDNMKELLPRMEDTEFIRLEDVEYIIKRNREITERNKEALLMSVEGKDGKKGQGLQLGIERTINKPEFLK